jgi:hypothetical protein
MYDQLADLTLLEEARARVGDEALLAALEIRRNTINLWRRRNRIPAARRAVLLRLIAEHPTEAERREHARIQQLHAATAPRAPKSDGRPGGVVYLADQPKREARAARKSGRIEVTLGSRSR